MQLSRLRRVVTANAAGYPQPTYASHMSKHVLATLLLGIALWIYASAAAAYTEPELSIGAIGAMVGLSAGALMLLVGSAWYPLKRLLHRLRSKD